MTELSNLIIVGTTGALSRQAAEVGVLLGMDVTVVESLDDSDRDTGTAQVFIAIEDGEERAHQIDQLLAQGLELATLVHPTAWVSASAQLGRNVFIGPLCVVAMDANVGNGVAQNALGSIEHDNEIADHVFLGTGAILCGRVTIGTRSFIGGGSVVKPGTTLAEKTLIGTGAVVVKDTEPNRTYVGNPARALGTD